MVPPTVIEVSVDPLDALLAGTTDPLVRQWLSGLLRHGQRASGNDPPAGQSVTAKGGGR